MSKLEVLLESSIVTVQDKRTQDGDGEGLFPVEVKGKV